MTTKDNGGPAFPAHLFANIDNENGLTMRDYFAAKAMQAFLSGHIAHYGHENHWPYLSMASSSYDIADAMIKARAA